jgi:NADPH:quinone reductase-like Zn-dependent oxidoreductase
MAPTKQKAVVITETGPTLCLTDVPKPGPGQILVRVIAAAQNPIDCQFTLTFGRSLDSLSICRENT